MRSDSQMHIYPFFKVSQTKLSVKYCLKQVYMAGRFAGDSTVNVLPEEENGASTMLCPKTTDAGIWQKSAIGSPFCGTISDRAPCHSQVLMDGQGLPEGPD
ncbi:hypothetical protein V1264_023766 [Littorina saxatilis]|uniref:Uncharacterized protein n=1 Tax=Littorina saxatilis TaxID=31220 RepID=A0AAN9FX95_9CAEN